MGAGFPLYPVPDGAFSFFQEFSAAAAVGAPPGAPFNTDITGLAAAAGQTIRVLGATISANGLLANFALAGTDFVRVSIRLGATVILRHTMVYDSAISSVITQAPAVLSGVYSGAAGDDLIVRCDTDEMTGADVQIYLGSVAVWGIREGT